MNLNTFGGRKFLLGLAAVGCCVWRPEAGPYIATIALAFMGAHAAQDWKAVPRNATVTSVSATVEPLRP